MVLYLIIVVLVLIAGAYGLWWLGQPAKYRRRVGDDLSKFFESLLSPLYESGFLIIEAADRERFVQLSRYEGNGQSGVQLDFPLAPWSERYYDMLNRILYERGIDYETQTTGEDTVVSFITVDFKDDWVRARDFSTMVLVDIFKLTPEDEIRIIFGK